MSDDPIAQWLDALAPSAKLVEKVPRASRNADPAGLADRTRLPQHTIRDTLDCRDDAVLVPSQVSFWGARQQHNSYPTSTTSN
ncbi:hypothetical protein GCM10009039_32030 [Halocalculus aciditolerans]|uniref:Uncharacterized protein n=1 Tax=Halocalculus aciditolerans TaxID=1383812 RepID=A0A830FQQ1_9EURY|nr:hypothetical protein GCM10009039_32030 [Halocalculus aciditolerans]